MSSTVNPTKEYCWFLRGKYLVVHEKDSENGGIKEPSETIANGLMVEMTRVPDFSLIDSEADILPVPEALEEALVYYVQAQLTEDLQQREYFLQRFNKKTSRFGASRTGGARVAKGSWVLR